MDWQIARREFKRCADEALLTFSNDPNDSEHAGAHLDSRCDLRVVFRALGGDEILAFVLVLVFILGFTLRRAGRLAELLNRFGARVAARCVRYESRGPEDAENCMEGEAG